MNNIMPPNLVYSNAYRKYQLHKSPFSLGILKRLCHLLDPDYSPLLDLMETLG